MILVHGIAASRHDWDQLTPQLVQAGYRAIGVDLLGHGDSPHPSDPKQYDLRAVYLSFISWLDGLNLRTPVHLVGHSLGGYLSIRYGLRRTEQIRSLTLVNPLYSVTQIMPALRVFRRRPVLGAHLVRIAPAWLIDRALAWDQNNNDLQTAEVRRQVAEDYKRASPHFLNITRRIPDLTPDLRRLHRPVLLLWGQQDRTLDPASFRRMVVRLPEVEHHCYPNSGHQPHIGQAQEVNRHILEWLSRTGEGASRDKSTWLQ